MESAESDPHRLFGELYSALFTLHSALNRCGRPVLYSAFENGGGSKTFCPFKGFGSTEPFFLREFGNPQPAARVSAGKRSCGEWLLRKQPPTPRYGGLSDLSGRTGCLSFICMYWRFPVFPTSLAMNCENHRRTIDTEPWCKAQPA